MQRKCRCSGRYRCKDGSLLLLKFSDRRNKR